MSKISNITINKNGVIEQISCDIAGQQKPIAFHKGQYEGPAIYVTDLDGKEQRVQLNQLDGTENKYTGTVSGLLFIMTVEEVGENICINVSLKNSSDSPVTFKKIFMRMGLDSHMVKWPEWREKYFPTLLRCEKTHFWGYAMNPNGQILGFACPNPINSWTIDYEAFITDNPDCEGRAGTTRLYTFCFDLLHKGPLPKRHPEGVSSLEAGKEMNWPIQLFSTDKLEEVKPIAASICDATMIEAKRYSASTGEELLINTCSPETITACIVDSDGNETAIGPVAVEKGKELITSTYKIKIDTTGQYRFITKTAGGKISECLFSIIHPYSWYIKQARKAADKHKQYASSHVEQWLGLHSAMIARKLFPEQELDESLDKRFNEILNCMWDIEKKEAKTDAFSYAHYRIFTNTAQIIAVLVDRYEVNNEVKWLEIASGLLDSLSSYQAKEGYYEVVDCTDETKSLIYTCVLYPAKCFMELIEHEEKLAKYDSIWKERYERHYDSVRRSMDHLEKMRDNIHTEGFQSFEDGMISCSSTQLALFALMQKSFQDKQKYLEASVDMVDKHRCLEQLLIPDSRMIGGTLRFWEAQYDVLARGEVNMMCSPHGWSAWNLYGIYYLYLLTGEEKYLDHLFNGVDACMNLVDDKTGEVEWAFICDPYKEVKLLGRSDKPNRGKHYETIIGEQPLSMIAEFHYPDKEPILGNSPKSGWCCCNDVHEVFKCMAETVLENAFVIELPDGDIKGYNCSISEPNDTLIIIPFEDVISKVHLNLKKSRPVVVHHKGKHIRAERCMTNGWVCLED